MDFSIVADEPQEVSIGVPVSTGVLSAIDVGPRVSLLREIFAVPLASKPHSPVVTSGFQNGLALAPRMHFLQLRALKLITVLGRRSLLLEAGATDHSVREQWETNNAMGRR